MKRLFITELDTALGRRVTEKFGLAKEYHISGTVRDPVAAAANKLSFVDEISPSYAEDAVEFKRRVLDSDIIICALTDSVLEAEASIKMLAHTTFETEKNFVLVSSMMTWTNTFAAQRAEELAEKARERQELIDAGEEVPEEEELLPEPTEEDLPVFTDDQYQKRVPHARYQHWRDLEHLTKTANSETLHTNIIFSGVTYGRGEENGSVMHDLFRSAWHGQSLPLFTAGSNVVPMIHREDLASLVYKVGSSSDVVAQRYILGVDRGNCNLNTIIKSINDTLGSGKSHLVAPSQLVVIPGSDRFTVDLRTEPGAAIELLEEADWVSVEGFSVNIEKIADEYKKFRGVTPIRSVIVGPPLAGKSKIASVVAQRYRIQHLTVSDIIRSYETNLSDMRLELTDARAQRRAAKKQADIDAKNAEEAERAAEAAAAAGGEEAAVVRDDPDAEGEDGEGKKGDDGNDENQTMDDSSAQRDDVSDIDFDDVLPALAEADGAINEDGEGGAAAADEGAAPQEEAIDPDEDEDEKIAKLKEDIAAAEKVVLLRRKNILRFDPNATAIVEGEGEGEEDAAEAAPGDEEAGEGGEEGQSQAAASPPPPENPFVRQRFIDEALAVMTRWRLGRKDCKNQGYVLDGFPKTVRQAALTFTSGELTVPEPEDLASLPSDGGDEGEDGALNPVDDKLFPENVLVLTVDDAHLQLLQSRSIDEPGKDITKELPDHNSTANFLRRLAEFKKSHTKSNRPQRSVPTWWKSVITAVEPPQAPRSVRVTEYDGARFQSELEDMMSEVYDSLGEPHFYRPTPEEIREAASNDLLRAEKVRLDAERKEEEARKEAKRLEEIALQESLKHKRRYETVQREQQEALILKSLPAQDYLMRYVVPALTAGIEHTTQLRPEDPLDALAEYLFAYTARTNLSA
ncbi:Hypothetical protein, putative [Bodo saltans]|uniref:Adenylate kinase n=1 Tax=Bodo saltans TaxID=75058 RepID=A0A0S4J6M2_BODSA|nr:Hypothetical protein, putative [Bodo saltans]|eukprot:CUG85763.1 Hypothetical protein, putative [Bodo saltans]